MYETSLTYEISHETDDPNLMYHFSKFEYSISYSNLMQRMIDPEIVKPPLYDDPTQK